MTENPYPIEVLDEDYDDGTMPSNVESLSDAVIGHRLVKAEWVPSVDYAQHHWVSSDKSLLITLDDGTKVVLESTDDCCAYTNLEAFLLNPELVDHVIMGVGTTDGYSTWHIYADLGDILKLDVGWSSGNPFYYGYGFNIRVINVEEKA